jgi:pimeloyl-ACP methyl ester carboxylesterase
MLRSTLTSVTTRRALLFVALISGGTAWGAQFEPPEGFDDCRVGLAIGHCGTVTVAENRETDDSRRLEIFAAVVPATGEERQPDPIVVLEGGPGASVSHFAGLHVQTFAGAGRARDLVLVDQRGTGRSAPLDCDLTNSFTELATPERARACREQLEPRADLARYTTTDAVEDLVEVLDRLGYDRVNLFGVSNGTRTALHFARRHPDRVRSIVLLAPYPFHHNVLLEGAETLDRSLALLVADCAADPTCGPAFPEIERSIETLKSPQVPADVDWPLFTAMLRMLLFFPLSTSQAPGILDSVASGCRPPEPGAAQTQLSGWISEGAFLSVLCSEDASRAAIEEIRQRAEDTFLGAGWAESLSVSCEEWPRRSLPADFAEPIAVEAPTLLLVGRLDPAMPPEWSHELAATMADARVVEVPEGQHSFVGMSGVGCLLGLIESFLGDASTGDLDTSCVAGMRRPPFVVPSG